MHPDKTLFSSIDAVSRTLKEVPDQWRLAGYGRCTSSGRGSDSRGDEAVNCIMLLSAFVVLMSSCWSSRIQAKKEGFDGLYLVQHRGERSMWGKKCFRLLYLQKPNTSFWASRECWQGMRSNILPWPRCFYKTAKERSMHLASDNASIRYKWPGT